MGGLQTKEGQPSWRESLGPQESVSQGTAASRKQIGLEPGQQGVGVLGRQAPRNIVAADRAETGAKVNLRWPGRSQAVSRVL